MVAQPLNPNAKANINVARISISLFGFRYFEFVACQLVTSPDELSRCC
jgi:hypothetical protein